MISQSIDNQSPAQLLGAQFSVHLQIYVSYRFSESWLTFLGLLDGGMGI
jgi:hypothetical protein